uniref:RNA helicase n=1 Tax=Denticeps clupeoides TaxID=299321 RepID=A0AAY4CWN9_9TELE
MAGLRPYQEEVVQRALRGENAIIWLPTGGGKTRAAVHVARRHLEVTPGARVAVLVNRIHLVDQHYENEFKTALQDFRLAPISGDSGQKDFFGCMVKDFDVIICTAQILENALVSTEEEKHVELTDFTLLIIDECHHTHKEGVYNKIMARYVEKKLRREEGLPQILGLTASPGTGGSKTIKHAVEHVLKICANLDSVIVSTKNYIPQLKDVVPSPRKEYKIANKRISDPFGDHLKNMMKMVHEFMDVTMIFSAFGTQEYEAEVVNLEKEGAFGVQVENRLWAQCAVHLRTYNDALLINDAVRMVDALQVVEDFYASRTATEIDGTDFFLSGLFQENRVELRLLASTVCYENPNLDRLERTLLEQFSKPSKCIIFVKTRLIAHCLLGWVCANVQLQNAKIKAAVLTGAGTGANNMSQVHQKDTIEQFRGDALNLLISTSVGEEGLDIPECNMVVRYGLLTNEIAQQQASGRARAQGSIYAVVAREGGRELQREKLNEYLEELTAKAVAEVQRMEREEPQNYQQKITELQKDAVWCRMLNEQSRQERRHRFGAEQVQLSCRKCFTSVAQGSDMRLIENSHHVNVNPDFKNHYRSGGQVRLERDFEEWEPGRTISCQKCGNDWGMEIKFKKGPVLPCLSIKSFSLKTPQGIILPKKWKDVEFPVEDFVLADYILDTFPDLDIY